MNQPAPPSPNSQETAPHIVAFTLCEPSHAAGAAALVNSLLAGGFQGKFILGLKGEPAGWLKHPPSSLPAGVELRIESTPGDRHLTHSKARFAQRIMDELEPQCDGVMYFDPDVVVKASWSELVQRVQGACSVCADENNPPWLGKEEAWIEFTQAATGLVPDLQGPCCNGGFVGVMRSHRAVIDRWEELLLECIAQGFSATSFVWDGQHPLPFFFVDQDMLNLAIRIAGVPVWIGGPETMDFAPGGHWLSHAISSPKPWERWYLPRVLAGRTIRRCDIAFWQYASGPVPAVPRQARQWHRLDLALARRLSRSPF